MGPSSGRPIPPKSSSSTFSGLLNRRFVRLFANVYVVIKASDCCDLLFVGQLFPFPLLNHLFGKLMILLFRWIETLKSLRLLSQQRNAAILQGPFLSFPGQPALWPVVPWRQRTLSIQVARPSVHSRSEARFDDIPQ